MAINIFEGARRITKLIAVTWVVGIATFVLMQNHPSVSVVYLISNSDRSFVSSHPSCDYQGPFQQKEFSFKTQRGVDAYIAICFSPEMKQFPVTIPPGVKYAVTAPIVATQHEVTSYVKEVVEFEQRYKEERTVVPTPSAKPRKRWGDDDPLVLEWDRQAFSGHIKNAMVLSQADEEWIQGQSWVKWWEQIRQGLLIMAAGLLFLWVLTWSIGWIVRGFLGIPRAQDHKLM